jgi:hypothetical protein
MSEARVQAVHADRSGARIYLDQAEAFQADADQKLSAESRSVLLHNAAVSAMLIPQASVDEAREATAELIVLARGYLRQG